MLGTAHQACTISRTLALLWNVSKSVASQILPTPGHDANVVLYADAAEGPQPVDRRPVDVMFGRRAAQVLEPLGSEQILIDLGGRQEFDQSGHGRGD